MSLDRTLALLIMLCMFAAFIWSALAYFKVGDSKGKLGRSLFSLLGLLSMILLVVLFFVSEERGTQYNIFASALFVLSGAIFWSSIIHSKKMGGLHFALSENKSSSLYTSGPYRVIRHPFYTSYTIAWFAGALCTNSVIGILPVIVMGILYLYTAKREESQFLASEHSDGYASYQSQTGMFFPRILK